MKLVLAFVLAVITAYVLAVLAYTQLNLANIVEMGLPVSMTDRIGAAGHDLMGMATLYLPIIAVALLLAFGFTAIVLRWVPQLRTLGYILAGFVGIFAVDFALGALLTGGTHPLAVTRTTIGLLSQCVAGAIGGYVFAVMLRQPE
ncbi:MAG: hypothetical protein ACFHXK_11440 [bacterium]